MSLPSSKAMSDTHNATKASWADTLKVYAEPATLRMLALGFAAGLPLLLVLGTLSFRLREAGIDRSTIGELSWVGLAYGFKWVWSPLVDRLKLPLLHRFGRRRSWLLASQVGIIAGLVAMAMVDPKAGLAPVVWAAILVAFCSATQDIALDAYRIELASNERQATLAATYVMGYRLAMIWAGAGVLWLASRGDVASAATYDPAGWQRAYFVMAASMLIGVITVLLSKEKPPAALPEARTPQDWLNQTLVQPFADFFLRYRWHAALILALIATYRISDVVMGIMANPFYVDMKYTKLEVASISKVYGLIMTIVGGLIGGSLSVLSALSNLLYVWLGTRGHDVQALTLVISIDNLASGIASVAFVAYLSSLTNIAYSAAQYAIFSSIMLLLPKWVGGFSGRWVDAFGYANFFTMTAVLGIPVLLLIWLVGKAKLHKKEAKTDASLEFE
jgi:MFS transporter, PAT family, beta-lactamase induction signal transducer AmpG